MPNGRSGGFPIEIADLKLLISEIAGTASIGTLAELHDDAPRLRPVSSEEVLRLVEACRQQRVAVEEQDGSYYIIHFKNEPLAEWLLVSRDSPLLAGLRQRHDQWKTEHPDWHGWIGF